jgi:hypothetical protein
MLELKGSYDSALSVKYSSATGFLLYKKLIILDSRITFYWRELLVEVEVLLVVQMGVNDGYSLQCCKYKLDSYFNLNWGYSKSLLVLLVVEEFNTFTSLVILIKKVF